MNLAEYREWIRRVPRPTDEQCALFAWHLCHVHSWYKVGLLRGTELVVYIDAEVGGGFTGGRRVGDHTWHAGSRNLQYRADYGRLAYMWRSPRSTAKYTSDYFVETVDERASPVAARSARPSVELPAEIVQQCSFVLFPYVDAPRFLQLADLLHMKALREIWAGRSHPGQRILRLLDESDVGGPSAFDYEAEVKPVWEALRARDWRPPGLPAGIEVPPSLRPLPRVAADLRWAMDLDVLTPRQRACARHLWRQARKKACLARIERNKIHRALLRLRALCGPDARA